MRRLLLLGLVINLWGALFCVQALMRDPTQPPGYVAREVRGDYDLKDKDFILTAIFNSPRNKSAVVNDRVVSIGDVVSGAEVVDIKSDEIKLQSGNSIFSIPLYQTIRNITSQKGE